MNKNLCECGCGKLVNVGNKYIHNHHTKGKKLSKERLEKIKNNSNYGMKGKKHSVESKNKMSQTAIKRLINRENHPLYGKKHSEESKKRMSNTRKNYLNEGKITIWNTLPKIKIICGICKKDFFVISSNLTAKYCSQECFGKSISGRIPWNKGVPRKEETKIKISDTKKQLVKGGKIKSWNKGITGSNSHSWKGGLSNKPYTFDFNKRFKETIRDRDNYCCKLCNIFEEDHLKLYKKRLSIHHIDYDKTLSIKENCITLCNRCNSLANKDREIWTKHFQELLKRDYGYQYTMEQKIILDFNQNETQNLY